MPGGKEGEKEEKYWGRAKAARRSHSLAEKRGAIRGSTLHPFVLAGLTAGLADIVGGEEGKGEERRGGRGYPGCSPRREFLIREMCAPGGRAVSPRH